MASSRLTHRYAKALLDLAVSQNVISSCLSDMKLIKSTCSENYDLVLLLKSPIVNTDKKVAVFKMIFESKLSKMTSLFVEIIINKNRESMIPSIAENFINLYKSYNEIATAEVVTATPLDKTLKNQIESYLKTKTNFELDIIETVDKNILGGAIIKMGDHQLDGSIKRNLKELKNTYNKNLYIKDF